MVPIDEGLEEQTGDGVEEGEKHGRPSWQVHPPSVAACGGVRSFLTARAGGTFDGWGSLWPLAWPAPAAASFESWWTWQRIAPAEARLSRPSDRFSFPLKASFTVLAANATCNFTDDLSY